MAGVYTDWKVNFKKVMTVVPNVWKRLMIPFLCLMLFYFLYNVVAFFVFAIVMTLRRLSNNDCMGPPITVIVLFSCICFVGFVYMNIVWQLGCVVLVLEDIRGTKALQKSRTLLKGKMAVATIISMTMNFLSAMIQFAFQKLSVHDGSSGIATRLVYHSIYLVLVFKVFLGLVSYTILYFVCKSYHRENIDESALSDHLEVYSGDYVPLKSKA